VRIGPLIRHPAAAAPHSVEALENALENLKCLTLDKMDPVYALFSGGSSSPGPAGSPEPAGPTTHSWQPPQPRKQQFIQQRDDVPNHE
jgi:hypothetical protein